MAESQVPFHYGAKSIAALIECLSAQRLHTYKTKQKTDKDVFELYLYNARLSKAFLFPLHVLEITLRNACDREFSLSYTPRWHTDASFQQLLTTESRESLQRALDRCTKQGKNTKGDVISTLAFDFWSNLFRVDYDRTLWQTKIGALLPNFEHASRSAFKTLISDINHFRNRIAHYEPIIGLDVSLMHSQIVKATGYISKDASNWIKSHSTVQKIIRTSPRADDQAKIGSMSDNNFVEVNENDNLADVIAMGVRFFVSSTKNGALFVFDHGTIGSYASHTNHLGLIDFSDHTVAQLLAYQPSLLSSSVGANEPQTIAQKTFKSSTSPFLVVVEDGCIKGVIGRSHRRY